MEWGCDSRGNSSLLHESRCWCTESLYLRLACDGRKQTHIELYGWSRLRMATRLVDGESTFCSKLQTMPPVLPVESLKQSWLKELNSTLFYYNQNGTHFLNADTLPRNKNACLRAMILFILAQNISALKWLFFELILQRLWGLQILIPFGLKFPYKGYKRDLLFL